MLQLQLPSACPLVPSLRPRSSCDALRGSEGTKEHLELPTPQCQGLSYQTLLTGFLPHPLSTADLYSWVQV